MRAIRRGLALALAVLWAAGPLRAAQVFEAPKAIPAIAAPLSFPVPTAGEFFSGAQRIVDLGGEPLHRWTMDLAATNPQARIELVNLRPIQDETRRVAEVFGARNLHGSSYDFFAPPEGHPTGDVVVMNSPHFGGLEDAQDVARFAEMIDRHLEPGGRFYAHADDLWLMSMGEMRLTVMRDLALLEHSPLGKHTGTSMGQTIAERHALVLEGLRRRFGADNVSQAPLAGYDPDQKLNVTFPKYTVQVRKPK